MRDSFTFWQTKLAARIHDPIEKALVLMRDPAGHENGTSLALSRLLGLNDYDDNQHDAHHDQSLVCTVFKNSIPKALYRHIQRADWWAAAADRPQFPMEEKTVSTKTGIKTFAVAKGSQVHFTKDPVLIHPLSGETVKIDNLQDTNVSTLKQKSFNHFSSLLVTLQKHDPTLAFNDPDTLRKILLTYWRFGPDLKEEKDNHQLGELWRLLPADTRVPDHTIWDHLDLTSAFAGAFSQGEPALFALSIGPVQGFIAQARSTSDLWAGSHLLSRLSWEAMRIIAERLGPDAILFPRLRGIAQVDMWLQETMKLPPSLFNDCEWKKGSTDANPLFSAALPNRLVAVVPLAEVKTLTQTITTHLRQWIITQGKITIQTLLKEAGIPDDASLYCYEQLERQLEGFPEIHWAAVPFHLIEIGNEAKQTDLKVMPLQKAMAPFYGSNPDVASGFLASSAWKVLQKEIQTQGSRFFAPNPGVLYPAVYDLLERLIASAKTTRSFAPMNETGWRCSLTGETEWLTPHKNQLFLSSGQRTNTKTLWTILAREKPSWVKEGEHLGALPAIKRLWPSLFVKEIECATENKNMGRFVVSTHTMALAGQLDAWLAKGGSGGKALAQLEQQYPNPDRIALPRRLLMRHRGNSALSDAYAILGILEASKEKSEAENQRVRSAIGQILDSNLEAYYSIIMMDGDKMGAILSGDEDTQTTISYLESFHPNTRKGFEALAQNNSNLTQYKNQKRAISPNRHLAVSSSLNDFSQIIVRHVVEEEYCGRLIYAGGDDVLAMLPVSDMLLCMQRLRHAYSGTFPEDEPFDWGDLQKDKSSLHCKNGFAYLKGKLYRMMSHHATASCGAVIAHHQAPLSAVLREVRAAEKRAKNEGGRNAFSITVIKRSGGALFLTEKWGQGVTLLQNTIEFLSAEGTSRRAVYNTHEWLKNLPTNAHNVPDEAMLSGLLAYQFKRQTDTRLEAQAQSLAGRIAAFTVEKQHDLEWLFNFLSIAEFLAREVRSFSNQQGASLL